MRPSFCLLRVFAHAMSYNGLLTGAEIAIKRRSDGAKRHDTKAATAKAAILASLCVLQAVWAPRPFLRRALYYCFSWAVTKNQNYAVYAT